VCKKRQRREQERRKGSGWKPALAAVAGAAEGVTVPCCPPVHLSAEALPMCSRDR